MSTIVHLRVGTFEDMTSAIVGEAGVRQAIGELRGYAAALRDGGAAITASQVECLCDFTLACLAQRQLLDDCRTSMEAVCDWPLRALDSWARAEVTPEERDAYHATVEQFRAVLRKIG